MNTLNNNVVFDLPKTRPNIIKVIGVGGAGGNAVNHMYALGIKDVDFVVTNTDYQALEKSRIPNRIQLGPSLTEGRGAGNQPEVGRNAAIENIEDVKVHLGSETKMVFVTAGMGGGTGTGAAPIIAQACREMGILTVGIVTLPFGFEGKKRLEQANRGLDELRQHCDTTLVISNDKVREIYGNLAFDKAFARADDVLATAAKGIAEIITVEGYVNVDFADVKTVLESSGKAVMGSATAEGEGRALKAIESAMSSPLLNDNDITGARSILLNISSGTAQITLDEIGEINEFIQEAAGRDTDIIWGNCNDDSLGESIRVTVIATGFEGGHAQAPVVRKLGDDKENAVPAAAPMLTEMRGDREVNVYRLDKDAPTPQPQENRFTSHSPANDANLFDFQLKQNEALPKINEAPPTEKVVRSLYDSHEDPEGISAIQESESSMSTEQPAFNDMLSKSMARIQTLRQMNTLRRVDAESLESLEKQPAYMRRGVDLDPVDHSSEPSVSRYTLSNNQQSDDKRPEIRPNNSFLHDNVD
ncbi:MAG: cell division protein FtsZ [Bacteroidia bacterium]